MNEEVKKKGLLKNKAALEEINRHLWIESEKAGHDIGFDQASKDWLENFSKAWMDYHMPDKKTSSTVSKKKKSTQASRKTSAETSKKSSTKAKK